MAIPPASTHSTRSWFPTFPLLHCRILGQHPPLACSSSPCKQKKGMCSDTILQKQQLSAALQAAQLWNTAANAALEAGHVGQISPSCSQSHGALKWLRKVRKCYPKHQTCAEQGLAGPPWDFLPLLQPSEQFALTTAVEMSTKRCPRLWARRVKGAQPFPSPLRTVIKGFP